jgi:hypothetical protein
MRSLGEIVSPVQFSNVITALRDCSWQSFGTVITDSQVRYMWCLMILSGRRGGEDMKWTARSGKVVVCACRRATRESPKTPRIVDRARANPRLRVCSTGVSMGINPHATSGRPHQSATHSTCDRPVRAAHGGAPTHFRSKAHPLSFSPDADVIPSPRRRRSDRLSSR